MNKLLTVCIPTYNRADITINLIKTLPFNDDVQFLVVDDGSEIAQFEKLEEFIKDCSFPISLYRKKNAGKLSAVRYGLEHAAGEFFMDIDDDDFFNENHLKNILGIIAKLNENTAGEPGKKEIAGFCGLCETDDHVIVGDRFPSDWYISNFLSIRADAKIKGDKKEVIRTEILRKVEVNFFENERRVPTSVQWAGMANNYSILFVNELFLIKNYLADGLTKNLIKVRVVSPNSSRQVYQAIINSYSKSYQSFSFFLRALLNFYRFSFHGASPFFPKKVTPVIFLFSIICIPVSYVIYIKDCRTNIKLLKS